MYKEREIYVYLQCLAPKMSFVAWVGVGQDIIKAFTTLWF